MKALCLRDCYVGERFWKKGETYELPDGMYKSEKNFRAIGVELEPTKGVTPTTEAETGFVCEVCGKVCKNKIGLIGHMKSHEKVATKKK